MNSKKLFKLDVLKESALLTRLNKEIKKMTTYNIPHAWTVGFDSVFDRIEKLSSKQPTYPPHNVVKHDEDSFEIAIAVAGFGKSDLSVKQEENVLTVSSNDSNFFDHGEIIHKGIAMRKFNKTFTLGEYIEVSDVSLTDGILSVFLEKKIPEEKKPKSFEIND